MKSKTAILFIKLGVSAIPLGYLISRVDYERLKAILHDAVPLWLALSMAILIARNWIGAWRCRVLLQAKGLDTRMSYAVVLYFTSQFFNIFLPTSLGGDVARLLSWQEDRALARRGRHGSHGKTIGFCVVDGFVGRVARPL